MIRDWYRATTQKKLQSQLRQKQRYGSTGISEGVLKEHGITCDSFTTCYKWPVFARIVFMAWSLWSLVMAHRGSLFLWDGSGKLLSPWDLFITHQDEQVFGSCLTNFLLLVVPSDDSEGGLESLLCFASCVWSDVPEKNKDFSQVWLYKNHTAELLIFFVLNLVRFTLDTSENVRILTASPANSACI